ncbi:diaminopimelate decarboxylase [Leptospira sp. GIMC2001]|uniref:diaminopimelate decarboxylase n=1 Tax=Leptospira sp. GIMC2001 TaxID=1513297 RepID=UPI0023492B51|nr:diaminopimelate decarboxylase [Leptospira sp. GIMC2001]WCL50884.1 diaminopimelate decarboxylase [Leptospira sp. GIMC2001]
MQAIEKLKFLNPEQVRSIGETFGTPIFIYSQKELEKRCDEALAFPNAYGLSVRYAMKANPNANILKIMRKKGIGIDASSEYEVFRALKAGFLPHEIMLTSQEEAKDLKSIIESGVLFNACSLKQLENYGKLFPGTKISVRFNPGLGSGHTKKTGVGGVTSSFGIWHEKISEIKTIVDRYKLIVDKVHTHIGSGSDPEVWKAVAHYTLEYAEIFPTCTIVSLGGGYKVGRMADEKSTNLQEIGKPVLELFEEFNKKFSRKLKLEIEPGTYFVATVGAILTRIDDIVDTGSKGFTFLKLDTGMDSNTRPSLYAAKHPMVVVPKSGELEGATKDYVVVGHCCESGDVFTQKEGGEPITRTMREAEVGDYVVMEGAGAYCSSMSTKNYNSFPETPEVLIDLANKVHLIRKKQTLDQIFANEIII